MVAFGDQGTPQSKTRLKGTSALKATVRMRALGVREPHPIDSAHSASRLCESSSPLSGVL
jgi:hypothetical protein